MPPKIYSGRIGLGELKSRKDTTMSVIGMKRNVSKRDIRNKSYSD